MAVADLSSPPRLEALLAVTRLVRADVPRLELVEAVAAAIATSLAFRTVVVNLRRPETGDFVVAAVHGGPEARVALMGTMSTWEDWTPVLEERFATAGVYLVPAGTFEWSSGPPAHVPDLAMVDDPQAWDGEDALFAPLTDTSGGLLGVISVDEPISGRKPSEEDLALLAGFCAHLGAALELADLGAAHGARTRALERLARTSVVALGTLDLDAALAETCAAVGEGLGFEQVEVALVACGRLITRGALGAERRLDGLTPDEAEGALGEGLIARLVDPDGALVGLLRAARPLPTSLRDIERRRLLRTFASQIEARLSSAEHRAAVDSEARKTAMLEASLDAIVTVDADRTVLEFNPAAQRIFGYRRQEAVGRDVTELLIPPELREGHRRMHDRVLALDPGQVAIDHRFEMPAMRADGTTFPSEIAVVRIELEGPPLLTAFVRDISDRVAARQALEGERDQARHAALHDPVTGLRNRSGALEHVTERMPSVAAAGGALLAVGLKLDGLDLINQSLGFAHGDDLLRAVGQRLGRRGGAWGWLVAHTGRCEFLVLVACADPSAAVIDAIASDVAATIERPFAVKGLELQVGAVVGHAVCSEPDAAPADLLRRVDVASQQARASGQITAYDAEADVSHRTLTRLSALHGAVDRSELELHYQPLYRVGGDRNLIGVEALLRWRHEGALIPPGDFIGLAETSGLIGSIGEWVIGEACRQARAWGDAGLVIPVVGINVSPRQLSGDVAGVVEAALAEHRLEPDRVCIEVTESAIERGARAMIGFLADVQELGVRSAIDDFGAEYSSLNRIASLPVQMIKLDRGFLRNVPEGARARRLLAGVIGVAKGLGVQTVIEGVERRSQLELLPGMGADLVQGFLLARPEPPDTVVARLASSPHPA